MKKPIASDEAASESYSEIVELLHERRIGLEHRLMIAAMLYTDCESFVGAGMGKEAAEAVKGQFIRYILSARGHFKEQHEKATVKN